MLVGPPDSQLEWGNAGLPARVAAWTVIAAGLASLAVSAVPWPGSDDVLFLGYLIVAVAAAAFRIQIPGAATPLSLYFFFVLLSLPRLSLGETLAIACAGAVTQGMATPKRWRPLAITFELAVAALSAHAAHWTFAGLELPGEENRSPLRLVVAASVLFLVTSAPKAAVEALAQKRSFFQVWRESSFWTFPHYVAGGGLAGLLGLMSSRTGWETALLIVPVVYWMFHSYRYYVDQLEEERRHVRELGSLHFRTIEALALAIEGHDPSKHGHLRRVSIYCLEIGRQMRLPEKELQALHAAAMLHDIGKIAVPEHIVTKPGPLSEAEFEQMREHPSAGAEILDQVSFPYPVAPVVRAHHEKWDGSGYPAGLTGTTIPVGARILAAVDAFDAMVSDRYHRRALSPEQAMEYLRAEAGRSFDPEVVAILAARYRSLEAKVQAARQAEPAAVSLAAARAEAPVLTRIAAARREEQQFFELARELGNSLSVEKVFAACAKHLQAMCPCDSLVFFLKRDQTLVPEYAGGAYLELLSSFPVTWGEGVAGVVAAQRAPMLNADPRGELAACTGLPTGTFRAALAVPIEGVTELLGVAVLYARERQAFSPDHLRLVTGVTSRAAGALENALKYTLAEQSATTDMLTGLPNPRSLFLHLDAELSRARRNQDGVTVLVCDLDRFKLLNDLHGHMAGNRALRAVAQTLKKQCREYDFVARLGGDEFVIVLPTHRAESAKSKVEQLRHAVAQSVPEIVGGIGISIGHACYPEDGEDAEALLAAADRRMYAMKQATLSESAVSTALGLQQLSERLGPKASA